MQTVDSILKALYDDDDVKAADRLKVGRSAVCNWKAWGYFPARLIPALCQHAREQSVPLDVADIPIKQPKPKAAASEAETVTQ